MVILWCGCGDGMVAGLPADKFWYSAHNEVTRPVWSSSTKCAKFAIEEKRNDVTIDYTFFKISNIPDFEHPLAMTS